MKYFLCGVLGFLICFTVLVIFKVIPEDAQLVIGTNTQYKTTTNYIQIPYTASKTNIYTNYINVFTELNDYLNAPGWISQSNNQIYAGIKDRVWSTTYSVSQTRYKHSVGIMAGDGIILDYGYQIHERFTLRGGISSKDSQYKILVGGNFKFNLF